MKRILCIIDGLGFGGAQRQIIGLVDNLSKKGYEVELVSYHQRDFYNELIDRLNIKHTTLRIKGKFDKIVKIWKHVKAYDYDVVISYLDGPNTICCLLKLLGIKAKLIVSERNTTQNLGLVERLRFNLYRFADVIVPNSYSQKEFVISNFPFLRGKISTITNFTETDYFIPKTIDIQFAKKEILIASRISHQKNILTFLDAIQTLKEEKCNVHFSWYGNVGKGMENYRDMVMKKYKSLELEDMIDFYPGTNRILEKYQSCDAFCLPSLFEGFPNVVCEAMSCGKPILCSNVCDNPNLVKHGENGFLFDPHSPRAIAFVIQKFCSLNKQEVKIMGKKSRDRVVQKCSSESFVNKYIELIED